MPDTHRAFLFKGDIAEEVVWVPMGVDHVGDREASLLSDRGQQALSLACTSAAIDHGNGVLAYDKPDVGSAALVRLVHQAYLAEVNEHTGCNLLDKERVDF